MSTPPPTPQASPAWRRLYTALMVAVILVAGVCGVGAPLLLGDLAARGEAIAQAGRDEAEADVERGAQEFALVVVAERDRDISDERRRALGSDNHVEVLVIERSPGSAVELLVVVEAIGHDISGWLFNGTADLVVCYEVVFADLGTATAQHGYGRLEECPATESP